MIAIQNLTFGYRKKGQLFKDLSLKLSPGHIYGLLGTNGAGKSTLLKLIAGLVHAQTGQIQVMGHQPGLRQPIFLQQVCFVPEEFYLPPVKTEAFIKTNAVFYPNFDFERFETLLKQFGLPKTERLLDMSYGQKKKFIIAFGLATNAPLLVMDEPTNGLDIPSKAEFRKAMVGAITDERCIIISTHQVRDLDSLIDTVIILDEHKIALNASMELLAEKLLFKTVKQLPEGVVYAEQHFAGHQVVVPNYHQEDTHVDLELLFNALLHTKQKLTAYLN